MVDAELPSDESLAAGFEVRDVWIVMVVAVGLVMLLAAIPMELFLWQLSVAEAPAQKVPGDSPPTVMPWDKPLNERIESIPPPRLDPLTPLAAVPPTYRSSLPAAGGAPRWQHPQDLWASRQPELRDTRWVEPGKVAHIPIDLAMEAVVERYRTEKGKK